MKLKVSLHIHTSEDKQDGHMIDYNVYRLINEAKRKGFDVLGFTPHKKYVFEKSFAEYAKKKGILLIPGVELSLGRFLRRHVIVLNCDKSVEKVKNFKQLIKYKEDHTKIFVLAPHPTFSQIFSLGARNLKKYINLFDAIEYCWLYSKKINSNNKAELIAAQYKKPMVATADVHILKKLDSDYAVIETDYFNADGVLSAVKQGKFQNFTEPKELQDIVSHVIKIFFKYTIRYVGVRIFRLNIKRLEPVEELITASSIDSD